MLERANNSIDAAPEALNETAGRILDVAQQLFMQRGYRAVSINDIVTSARITKPTLYYYFADKEELFVQVSLAMLHDTHRHMDAIAAQPSSTAYKLEALAESMLGAPGVNSRMVRQEAREHLSDAQQQRLGEAFHTHMMQPLTALMRATIVDRKLATRPPEELAMMFLALLEGFHYQSANGQSPMDVAAPSSAMRFSSRDVVDLFLNGVVRT